MTLLKFTILAILLHFTECTIEWYQIKLSEPITKPVQAPTVKGGILPIKQFKRPKWVGNVPYMICGMKWS